MARAYSQLEAQFMKEFNSTEAELKKSVAYKKTVYSFTKEEPLKKLFFRCFSGVTLSVRTLPKLTDKLKSFYNSSVVKSPAVCQLF